MKLLCLLVENRGQLVSRDRIIEDIWNGYGGGDEGLTQAISSLRKILNDKDKQVIETVPKSGYIFRGEVADADTALTQPVSEKRQRNPFKRLAYTGILLAVLVAGVLVFLGYERGRTGSGNAGIAPEAPQKKSADSVVYAPQAPAAVAHNTDTVHPAYAPKAPARAPRAPGQ